MKRAEQSLTDTGNDEKDEKRRRVMQSDDESAETTTGPDGSNGGTPEGEPGLPGPGISNFLRRFSRNDASSSRWATMLEDLKSADESRQIVALTDLSEYLSFSTEELLLCFPVESFVTAFFAILSADGASEDEMNASTKQLLCCRCLYSLVDILPNTSRYVLSSGGLQILCSKLVCIQYIDVAEQCISIFQRLAEYGPIQVLKAGSLQPVLMFLDFFALPSQRAAVSAAASMVAYIPSSDVFDQHVKPAVPQLLALLQHQDARVRETAGGALRNITDSLVHLHRRHTNPTPARSAPWGKREDATTAHAARNAKIGEALECLHPLMEYIAITLDTPGAPASVVVEALHMLSILVSFSDTNTQQVLQGPILAALSKVDLKQGDGAVVVRVLCVALSLLPAVHPVDFSCVLDARRRALFSEGVLEQLGPLFFPALLQVHAMAVSPTIQALCVSVCLSFVLTCSNHPEILYTCLPPATFSTFLANLLFTSCNKTVLFSALSMVEELLRNHQSAYGGMLVRHGVVRAAHVLVSHECPRKSTRLLSQSVKEGASGSRSRQQLVEGAAHQVLSLYFGASSHTGESAILRALSRIVRALSSNATGEGEEQKKTEALQKLQMLLLSDDGVSGFEFTCSDCAAAIVKYLYPEDSSLAAARLATFTEVMLGGSPESNVGIRDGQSLTALVKLCVASICRYEDLELVVYTPTGQTELPPHLQPTRNAKEEEPKKIGFFPAFLRCMEGQREHGPPGSSGSTNPAQMLKLLSKPLRLRLLHKDAESPKPDESSPSLKKDESPGSEKGAASPAARLRSYLASKVSRGARAAGEVSRGARAAGPSAGPAASPQPSRSTSSEADSPPELGSPGEAEPPREVPRKATSSLRMMPLSSMLGGRSGPPSMPPSPQNKLQGMEASPRSPGRLRPDESTPMHGPLFCSGPMVMVEPLTTVSTLEEYLSNKWSELGLGGKDSSGEEKEDSSEDAKTPKQKPRLYIGDKRLNPGHTLVQALIAHVDRRPLRKESAVVDEQDRLLIEDLEEDAQSGSLATHVWGSTHALRYVLEDPVQTKKGTPSPDTTVSFLARADVPVQRHFAQRAKIADLEEKGPSTELLTILTLLGALHGVFKTVSASAAEDASLFANLPEPNDFVSTPLASKFMRQLADPVAICSRSLAPWCRAAVLACPFLFPHEARRTMHSSCLLGLARALHFCYGRMETGGNDQMEVQIAAIPRRKVRIDRANLIVDAARVMNSFGTSQALVEIEYVDEVGTGSGPTLEFYAQIVDHLRAHNPPLFRSSEFGVPLYFHPYPAAFYATPEGESLVGLAKLLGQVVGKCIMDGRVIDLDISFIALALAGHATEADFAALDPAMRRSQQQLRGLGAADVAALQLPWTLPGYPAVELRPGGAELIVESHEVGEYIATVAKWSMVDGVQPLLLAFRKAVFSVLPDAVAQLWTPAELAALLGAHSGATADQYWTMEHFNSHILAQHGYTQDSAPFVALLERMASFTIEERRGFLQFVTGAPSLPVGGFAGLKPPLTVVKRETARDAEEKPIPNDHVLPSVMTCANYLKLPEYSSPDVLRERLGFAVAEGKNAFLLS
jgi:hypothetical protein